MRLCHQADVDSGQCVVGGMAVVVTMAMHACYLPTPSCGMPDKRPLHVPYTDMAKCRFTDLAFHDFHWYILHLSILRRLLSSRETPCQSLFLYWLRQLRSIRRGPWRRKPARDCSGERLGHQLDRLLQRCSGWLSELVMGHFFKTQPNPQKSSPDPTQPIIDTWYGILGYTDNFIQLLHVTDKFK